MCCCQNTPLQTVTVQFVMYVQCAQHYCKTQCVAVRTHRYRPSEYNLLCTFSVHKHIVRQNVLLSEHKVTDRQGTIFYVRSVCTTLHVINHVLLSEHTVTDRHSTIFYLRLVCTTLLKDKMYCCQNTPLQTVKVQFLCTFSVHNITVTHNVLLSEHTVTESHSTICYVLSTCTILL